MFTTRMRTVIAMFAAALTVAVATESALPPDSQARPKRPGQYRACKLPDGSTLDFGESHTEDIDENEYVVFYCTSDGQLCYDIIDKETHRIESGCASPVTPTKEATPAVSVVQASPEDRRADQSPPNVSVRGITAGLPTRP